jgi:hypothetical protein
MVATDPLASTDQLCEALPMIWLLASFGIILLGVLIVYGTGFSL